ncbi:MAG TPA: bifunctional DNA-binding transcriptional regulator/O6-methylguanine-DNA methyltransferase Ada [Gemmatimonadales bacterium]|nr:bifunctional DNA-binding transcriptional regulator/O6-methylguanine-DNA methyltransferase Ada [Gemmatimonadales bacterium]
MTVTKPIDRGSAPPSAHPGAAPVGAQPAGGHAPDPDRAWAAVVARDGRYDDRFVYAVRSTGVYCRPSCGARRPRRDNVVFFPAPDAAEAGGFRPCRRCRPSAPRADDADARAVQRACRLLDDHLESPPPLRALGAAVGMSPWHLQRVFRRKLGLTPRAYAEARRLARFQSRLRAGETVSRAMYGAGYGSSRGVYEGGQSVLGMTPGAYRRGGAGLRIRWTIAPSPLGLVLIAATERGVCAVQLGDDESRLAAALRHEFPAAELVPDDESLGDWVAAVVRRVGGEPTSDDVPLDVRATAFQWRVWTTLRGIPRGETRTYAEVARDVGAPRATRAVARACASNPVAVLVPCHRVVRTDGELGGYRWGLERKAKLLQREREAAG